jgi:fermentation-respiration switch protein FrsA (DUF1100 family)
MYRELDSNKSGGVRAAASVTGASTWAALLLACAILASCDAIFFQPNSRFYHSPEQFGLRYEEVWIPSAEGTRLNAWFLPGLPPVRGTIVFFHGNAANISNHLYAVRWLPREGYSVLLFDYRGYGASEGQPGRAEAIADGVAAIRYARGRPDVNPRRVIVYGQSLGGALAMSALAESGTEGVRALIVEAAFRSYREVARLKMDESWLTWAFQYPLSWLLFSDRLSPEEILPRIARVPTLVVHRTRDDTVPFEAGRRLYESLPAADKTFWAVEGGGHIQTFVQPEPGWRERLLDWLEERAGKETENAAAETAEESDRDSAVTSETVRTARSPALPSRSDSAN